MQIQGCSCSCCDDQVTVNVPGAEGAAGADGADGVNAYSITTTQKITVPAVGSDVTAYVDTTQWMAQGQFVVIGNADPAVGPGTFQVKTITDSTTVVLTFMGYPGDVAVATEFPIGSTVVSAGEWGLPDLEAAYGAGTAYQLTNSAAAINLGTTDPEITLSAAGTYLIFGHARIDYNDAQFSSTQRTVTIKARRTNNTAADITNSTASFKTLITTDSQKYTACVLHLPVVQYTTTNDDDVVALFGVISALPSNGSVDIEEAAIQAIKIA